MSKSFFMFIYFIKTRFLTFFFFLNVFYFLLATFFTLLNLLNAEIKRLLSVRFDTAAMSKIQNYQTLSGTLRQCSRIVFYYFHKKRVFQRFLFLGSAFFTSSLLFSKT